MDVLMYIKQSGLYTRDLELGSVCGIEKEMESGNKETFQYE